MPKIVSLLALLFAAPCALAQNYPVELRVNASAFGLGTTGAHPSTLATAFVGVPAGTEWVDYRLQLPPGVHYLDQVANGSLPQLPTTCTATPQPDGSEHVNCRSTGIDVAPVRQHHTIMRFAIPDPSMLPGDGLFSITYSLHIPGRDPDFNQCSTTGGRIFVGCAVLEHEALPQRWSPRTFRHAEVPQHGAATWGTPMRIGKRAQLGIEWDYSGQLVPGVPATAYLLLPPGVRYTPSASQPLASGVTCETDAQVGGRELVVCAISAMNMSSYVMIQPLILTLDRGVPAGPTIAFHGVIDTTHQPMPEDWLDDPAQACEACYTLNVPVLGPRLQISTAMPLPTDPWVVGRPYELDIWLRNNELSGISGTLHLHVQLPPGMSYHSHAHHGWPASTCQTAPSSFGQVLTCTWATGLGAQDNRRVVIRVDTDTALAAPGPVPILFALEEHPTATAATELERCEATPNAPDCFLLWRPTEFLCASQHADGVFCDGFQTFVRPEP